MLEEWTHLPRWFKLLTAVAVLGYAVYWGSQGVISAWGFGIGFLLFVMSFMKPLGPPRKTRSPPVGSNDADRSNPYRVTPAHSSTLHDEEALAKAAETRREELRRRVSRPRPKPYWSLLLGAAIAAFAAIVIAKLMR